MQGGLPAVRTENSFISSWLYSLAWADSFDHSCIAVTPFNRLALQPGCVPALQDICTWQTVTAELFHTARGSVTSRLRLAKPQETLLCTHSFKTVAIPVLILESKTKDLLPGPDVDRCPAAGRVHTGTFSAVGPSFLS